MEIVANKKPLTYFGDNDLTPVQQFYHEKNVLITGASGFMGKVLLEKLLRSCAGVGNVYVLLRPKRGELPAQRIEKLMKDPVSCRNVFFYLLCALLLGQGLLFKVAKSPILY
jgi:FlaA1/EpsC-like NDP-sugar epimerase